MRTLVHRRQIRSPESEAGGPGSTVGPLLRRVTAPLSWMGWLSLVGAVGYIVVTLWPVATGERPPDLNEFTPLALLHELAAIATILLPAALEFGYLGVAQRNRWLLRGALLLALAQLAQPVTAFVGEWVGSALFGSEDTVDLGYAFAQLLAIARVLVTVIAWLAIFVGLGQSGARPRSVVAATAVLVGMAVWVADFLPSFDQFWMSDRPLMSAANVVAIFVAMLQSAVTTAVVAVLLTGAFRQLQPRLGWRLGAAAAVAIAGAMLAVLLQVVLGPSTRPDGSQDYSLFTVSAIVNTLASLLLLAACLAGIGRGTDERRVSWTRRRVFVVTGDRRVRLAGG